MVGTSVDPVPRLQRFRDKYGLRFPLVSDHDRAIGSAYGTLKGGPESSHERDTGCQDCEDDHSGHGAPPGVDPTGAAAARGPADGVVLV